ncbi:MAG: N-acyl homoserine lactonase family protein [Sphingomonas sp.]
MTAASTPSNGCSAASAGLRWYRNAASLLIGLAIALGAPASAADRPIVELTRLDCGTGVIKDFNTFSDTHEYPPGPHPVVYSCYLIRHLDQYMLWGTGFPAASKGKSIESARSVLTVTKTIAEQLAALGLKESDIDVVGVSHWHGDHTGQAKEFPTAKLLVGKADFELSAGDKDPFGPWRIAGAKVQTMHGGDVDVFGDGSVIALNMPSHTPDHMALLVKLASGNVLLSGDLYHSTMARALKIVPPGNSSRADTLASMDRFERLAKSYSAMVIIEHEPDDVAKLPAFPMALR